MPGTGGRRNGPPGSLEDVEDVALERLTVALPPYAGSQLLCDDNTEILERRERSMESLQGFVSFRIAKRVDEDLRVQDVPARRSDHGSTSGDEISTPSMARVPSTSSR